MKDKIKTLIPFAILYFIIFDILAIAKFFNVNDQIQNVFLLIIYPVLSLTTGFIFAIRNGFAWWFLIVPAITLFVRIIIYSGTLYAVFLFLFIFIGFCMGGLMKYMNEN